MHTLNLNLTDAEFDVLRRYLEAAGNLDAPELVDAIYVGVEAVDTPAWETADAVWASLQEKIHPLQKGG